MVSYKKRNMDDLSSAESLSPSPSSSRSRSRLSHKRNSPSAGNWNGRRNTDHNKQGRRWSCMLCKKDHRLATCSKYMAMNTHNRLEVIRKLRYCVNCLAISHSSRTCRSASTCSICHKRHHSTLHHTKILRPLASVSPSNEVVSTNLSLLRRSPSPPVLRKHVVIPTIRMALIYNGIRRIVRALINPSQPFTTISQTIAKQCRLATRIIDNKCMCTVQIGNVQNLNWQEELQAMVTDVLPLRPYPHDLQIAAPFDTVILADPDFYISDEVHIVLAADIYPKIIADGLLTHETGDIVAQATMFGWTLTGSIVG